MTDQPIFKDINAGHLKNTLAAAELGSVKVVLVGDSLMYHEESVDTTETYGHFNSISTAHQVIKRVLQEQFGDVDVNLVNRAITSADFNWLDAYPDTYEPSDVNHPRDPKQWKPAPFPAWYTNQTRAWLDYVADEDPDLILVALGGNYPEAIDNFDAFLSAVTKLTGSQFENADVIFLTTILGDDGSTSEEDRLSKSGAFVRDYCKGRGIGIVDVGRQESIIRNGLDPADFSFWESQQVASPGTKLWTAAQNVPARAWISEVEIDQVNTLDGSPKWGFQMGGSEDWIYCQNSGAGFVVSAYIGKDSGQTLLSEVTSAQVAAGSAIIKCTRDQNFVVVEVDDVVRATFPNYYTWSSLFTPKIGTYPTANAAGPNMTNIKTWYGKARTFTSSVTDDDLYGVFTGGVADFARANPLLQGYTDANIVAAPNAGDGVVHVSDFGVRRLFRDTLQRSTFRPGGVKSVSGGSGSTPNLITVYDNGGQAINSTGWTDWQIDGTRILQDDGSDHLGQTGNIVQLKSQGIYSIEYDFEVADDATVQPLAELASKWGVNVELQYRASGGSWITLPGSARTVVGLWRYQHESSGAHTGLTTGGVNYELKVRFRKSGSTSDHAKTNALGLKVQYLGV